MTTRMRVWMLVALLIAAVLGGASLIVANNRGGADADVPAGVVH
jgi:hypothetical protein